MYSKKDAVMTKGVAIFSMVVLHLFCRTGNDVYGTPLLWLNETTPFVYLFGFFSNICVPLYSICAGYGQYLMYENQKLTYKGNFQRIFKLLVNYWIVLILFCGIGLIYTNPHIPLNFISFIKSIFLLYQYNGAWWYLNTYIILLLLPTAILLFPVIKAKRPAVALSVFLTLDIIKYFLFRFNIFTDLDKNASISNFVLEELFNITKVLPFFWIGALLCKFKIIDLAKKHLDKYINQRHQKSILILITALIFTITVLLNKSIIIGVVSLCFFMAFNLIKKSAFAEKIILFLGKHSTNIWLTHMFFYMVLFKGLVQSVKYPLLMLLLMLTLSIISSYIIMFIQTSLFSLLDKTKKQRNTL